MMTSVFCFFTFYGKNFVNVCIPVVGNHDRSDGCGMAIGKVLLSGSRDTLQQNVHSNQISFTVTPSPSNRYFVFHTCYDRGAPTFVWGSSLEELYASPIKLV